MNSRIETKLTLAEDAQLLLRNDEFVAEWKQLAQRVDGFTVLQEIEFVDTWYEIHREYDPVLSIAYDKEGELAGIMCLAWHIQGRFITHAGHYDAEYHGWLAGPSITFSFLEETLQLLKNHFQVKKWEWGWLPPDFSGHYFENINKKGISAIVESESAPIWDLTNPGKLRNFQKSRSLKSKFNRYKKRGDYRIEIITDPERTTEVLKLVSPQCDLRHEAINNSRPFEEDPHRIPFCTALQNYPGLLHVSAMWLDNQLLAFHSGIADNKRVCLGLSSYDPSESKQSPGTLLLVELAKILTEQGYEIFDLTPGKDMYKERFANQHQILSKPTITFTTKAKYVEKIKYKSRGVLFRLLPLIKTDIHAVQRWKKSLPEFRENIRILGIFGMFQRIKKKLFLKKIIYVYFLENVLPNIESSPSSTVLHQHYESLMKYENENSFRTKRRFLKEALKKFGNGETLFSAMQNDQLSWMGWLTDTKKPVRLREISRSLSFERGSHTLYDFYYQNSEEHSKENFFRLLKSAISQLNLTNFLGLNICLEAPFQLSEEQISTLGISSEEKVVYTNIGYFYKKVHVKKIEVSSVTEKSENSTNP